MNWAESLTRKPLPADISVVSDSVESEYNIIETIWTELDSLMNTWYTEISIQSIDKCKAVKRKMSELLTGFGCETSDQVCELFCDLRRQRDESEKTIALICEENKTLKTHKSDTERRMQLYYEEQDVISMQLKQEYENRRSEWEISIKKAEENAEPLVILINIILRTYFP